MGSIAIEILRSKTQEIRAHLEQLPAAEAEVLRGYVLELEKAVEKAERILLESDSRKNGV